MLNTLKTEFKELDTSRKKLRVFGLFMGGVLLLVTLWLWWKEFSGLWQAVFGVTAFLFAYFADFAPRALLPFYYLWMGIALVLGTVISPLVLGILFYLFLTPIGLLKRVFGARPATIVGKSHWIPHAESQDPKRMENLF
jgi:hypothetical protein